MKWKHWELKVSDGAKREMGRLKKETLIEEAGDIIEDLAEDPFPPGTLLMDKHKDTYRLHFGDDGYRIVYKVDIPRRTVTILRVRPRPTAYRGMRNG